MELTDNINIKQFKPLITPKEVKDKLPETDAVSEVVAHSRRVVQDILTNRDPRRVVIVGPCSLHDTKASLEYAQRLKALQDDLAEQVLIVMRTYFEKPRTTVGWKGMIYDPDLDDSCHIAEGILKAREVMLAVGELGLPVATEFLDPIIPQYLADLVTWASIGARTTESQIHRQMASGLSMPIGFKNATDGNLEVGIQAIKAAAHNHAFLGIDRDGKVIVAETTGNQYGHLVMRGGANGPNYQPEYMAFADVLLQKSGITNGVIIDCSHANSQKDHTRQGGVFLNVLEQMREGNRRIAGVMLESFLGAGNQSFDKPENLQYGVSVTDKCLGWEETEQLLREFQN